LVLEASRKDRHVTQMVEIVLNNEIDVVR